MSLVDARRIADAVLYEGYVLYPYRASSGKNRVRWQFGTFVPHGYASAGSEPWAMQTECLVEPETGALRGAEVRVTLRFLQLQHRQVESLHGGGRRAVDALELEGERWLTWDEGVAREIELGPWSLAALLAGPEESIPLVVAGGRDEEHLERGGRERGRLVRRRWRIRTTVHVRAEAAGEAVRFRVRVENSSAWPPSGAEAQPAAASERDLAMRRSLLGAHLLLAVEGGAFVSLLDPPAALAEAARACVNENALPVLVGAQGERDVMLSSPILLYDYPAIAPESPENLCDGTEIDEILTLRVLTMTDDEKREARATDARARRIVDHADAMPPENLARLHGVMRELGPVESAAPRVEDALPVYREGEETPSWESFLNPPGEAAPEDATCVVAGTTVRRGSLVRLRPGRHADSMDFFLAGRTARVEGVYTDLEGRAQVAVTVADDPAGELHSGFGRFFYYHLDEIEPLGANAVATSFTGKET